MMIPVMKITKKATNTQANTKRRHHDNDNRKPIRGELVEYRP
jgi:hypothetical protein